MIVMQVQLPQLYPAADVSQNTRLRLKGFWCKIHAILIHSPFLEAVDQRRGGLAVEIEVALEFV